MQGWQTQQGAACGLCRGVCSPVEFTAAEMASGIVLGDMVHKDLIDDWTRATTGTAD